MSSLDKILDEKPFCTPSCENKKIKNNCTCKKCTPHTIPINSTDKTAFIPIYGDKIINCAKIEKNDVGVNQPVTFTVNGSMSYSESQPVCIQNVTVSYDFIGLSGLQNNNLQTIIYGNLYTFTADNIFPLSSTDTNNYLFDSSHAVLKIKDCCSHNNSEYRNVRIVETSRFFEIVNLVINVNGYIGCCPFTATASISDNYNTASSSLKLSTLGLISSATFDSWLCLKNTQIPVKISESYKSSLYVDCIRPTSYYTPPSSSDDQGTFTANADFSFYVKKSIYVSVPSSISVLSNLSACFMEETTDDEVN